MQIGEKQFFLQSSFEASTQIYQISIIEDQNLQHAAWNGSTRISPVWPVLLADTDARSPETRSLTEDSYMCFVGPIAPPKLFNSLQTNLLSKLGPNDIWLTLGHFNFVLFLQGEDEVRIIREFCIENKCLAEFWRVLGDSDLADFCCDEIRYFKPECLELDAQKQAELEPTQIHLKQVMTSVDASIKQAFLEFYSLRQISWNRSSFAFNPLRQDVHEIVNYVPTFEEAMNGDKDIVESETTAEESGERERLNFAALKFRDQILNINAGLSRHISQALSGTSPLNQTECHFWPHSLLGTGVANLALRNLTSYIIENVNDAKFNFDYYSNRLPKTFERTGVDENDKQTVSEIQLEELAGNSYEISTQSSATSEDDSLTNKIPNPITYFSGRDGFRYGVFTVSAPLLSISGCNSKQWNLGTISHELSHRVICPKIQKLLSMAKELPKEFPELSLEELCRRDCSTNQDAATVLLVNAIAFTEGIRIGVERYDRTKLDTETFISTGIMHNERELEEKIVHMFDYYHFYDQDPNAYVSNIWQSWAIQPSIATKFGSYVERTAVALTVKHISNPNWIELTIDDFINAASKENFWHQTLFRDKLEKHLNDNRGEIIKILRRNWPLIALFLLLFRSKPLATSMEREGRDTSKARQLQLYDISGLEFPKLENPLKFTRQATMEKTPNSAKSAWLLSVLAFGTTGPSPQTVS